MKNFLRRFAVVALCCLPRLALGEADLPGSAAVDGAVEMGTETMRADDTFTILLAEPGPAPTESQPATETMPESFYLGDNCEHVEPALTV